MEIFGVGPGWTRESGKPGAIWAAQRIGDDQALVIPNWSIIKEIRPEDKENFMVSANYHAGSRRPRLVQPGCGQAFHLAGHLRAAAGGIRHQPLLAFLQHVHAQPGPMARPQTGQESHGHHQSLSPVRRTALPLSLLGRPREKNLRAGRDRLPALGVRRHHL